LAERIARAETATGERQHGFEARHAFGIRGEDACVAGQRVAVLRMTAQDDLVLLGSKRAS